MRGILKWLPFWNSSTLWSHISWTLVLQVLCTVSEKIELDRVLLVSLASYSSRALPPTQNPRYWFCSYNRLNSYLLVHDLFGDIYKCALAYSEMTKNLHARLNWDFFFFLTGRFTKRSLWTYVRSFEKIYLPVFDLRTSRQIDSTWVKVRITDQGLIGLS